MGRLASSALRSVPLTIGLTLVVLLVSAVVWRTPPMATPAWRSAIRDAAGFGYEQVVVDGHWWALLTGALGTDGALGLIAFLLVGVPALVLAERRLGAPMTLLAVAATAVAGNALAIGLQLLGTLGGEFWSGEVARIVAFDPFSGALGALAASSAVHGSLWRRRIRAFVVVGALIVLLYSGLPQDLARLFAALVGVFLGALLAGRSPTVRRVRSSHHETRVLMASVVAMMGVGPLITLLSGRHLGPLAPLVLLLEQNIPDAGRAIGQCRTVGVSAQCLRDLTLVRVDGLGAVLLSVVPMVALLFAAWGLLRGRRFAVWFAAAIMVSFAALSAVSLGAGARIHAAAHPSPLVGTGHGAPQRTVEIAIALWSAILLPLVVAGLLLVLRRGFPVRATRRSAWGYLALVGSSWVLLASLFVVVALAHPGGFSPRPDLGEILRAAPERFVPAAYLRNVLPGFVPIEPIAGAVFHAVGPIWWSILLLGAVWPLSRVANAIAPADERRLRALLAEGSDSIGHMTTWPGNLSWFDPERSAGIAYRVISGVAVTTGGFFGRDRHDPAVLERFVSHCEDSGLTVALYSVDSETAASIEHIGWRIVQVAEETVLHPQGWSMVGKRWQDIRSSVNRADRAGITAVWSTYGALGIGLAAQIAEISEEWVAERRLPEMGFTLGGLDELIDEEVGLLLAVDAQGMLHGVTSWLPVRRSGELVGWTLDFMRRRTDGMNGVMEFLIAEAAARFNAEGIEEMSLSAAPLARSRGTSGQETGGIDRVLSYLGDALEPVYGFRSLLAFKGKFQPEERPLVLGYADPLQLPAIGLAIGRAYLPDVSVRDLATLVT
ncbi:DUF2156 domain-containing protein [Plantibacter flavus]|uniref:bifunctional lysylphosphatidylglycerol flippase/synthetase MprF n=1 Tax=Plantibacter flavus TaxID=150123 RepID=UPI003F190047